MAVSRQPDDAAPDVDRLVSDRRTALVAIARAIVEDPHEAEDVVQDTIVAALPRLAQIQSDKRVAYLSEAVRRNAIKRKTRRREFPAAPDVMESVTARDAESGDGYDPLDLEEAIQSLPVAQQAAVRMKFYAGLTFREIGVALSISTNTAASRCRYAISKLRTYLERDD